MTEEQSERLAPLRGAARAGLERTFIERPSPNFDSREGQAIDMLVLHYTGMPTRDAALNRLCDPQAKVSAHYVVDEDGAIYRLVDEGSRAWHAGASYWRSHTNINQRSIGIEIVNPGHEFGYRPFPKAQMEAVAALCKDILSRHAIPPRNVVAHSDIAPSRKEDPGELFDWKWLAGQGVGQWPKITLSDQIKGFLNWELFKLPPPSGRSMGPVLYWGKSAHISLRLMKMLGLYGYEMPTAILGFDKPEIDLIKAFQRHYRPALVSGSWDHECHTLLAKLLKTV